MSSGLSYQLFVDDNHRVFIYEDDMWTIKGWYDHALEDDDEDVSWTYENGNDVLRFLLVSFPWYVSLNLIWMLYRWMMSIVVNHRSLLLSYLQLFLLVCLLRQVILLIPPLLVWIHLLQGFYPSLAFLPIWRIVMIDGLHVAYEKYKAYLDACRTYERKVADGSWSGGKLTGSDLIQLFVSKSFWHSHYKPLFSKVSNHPDMVKWLEGDKDRLPDEVLWGYKKGSYQFKDLNGYLEQHERKKGKRKAKDEKAEGSSKKKKDKSNMQV